MDSLVFTVASNGVPNDPNGVIAKTAFILKIQAKSPAGVVPDTSFNAQNVSFTLTNMNTSVGEAVSSSTVNFVSGVTSPSPTVTIVQASGTLTAPSSVRQIVVSANATGNVFFPELYWKVTMDLECWKNPNFTGCTYDANGCAIPNGSYFCTVASGCGPGCTSTNKNQPQGYASQTAFVALPFAGMCGTQIVLEAQPPGGAWSSLTTKAVGDIGPGSTTNDYWFTGGPPAIGGCLSDLLMSQLNIPFSCTTGVGQATVLWRFAL